MAINRYNPNYKLTRLKMELEEAENELKYASDSRKPLIKNRIENIKDEIRRLQS